VPARGALFYVESKTTFRLAHGRPGVLLELERGRLRGVFEPAAEGDDRERLVTTPSAVLAVRGTEYGVEVEKNDDTAVDWDRGRGMNSPSTGSMGSPQQPMGGQGNMPGGSQGSSSQGGGGSKRHGG